jgi:hypothetical protein
MHESYLGEDMQNEELIKLIICIAMCPLGQRL